MELKQLDKVTLENALNILIVPDGIETSEKFHANFAKLRILIVPDGIETP